MRRAFAAAMVAAVFAVGCVPYARLDQPGVEQYDPSVPRVMFGGDSITVSVRSRIRQQLNDDTPWWSHFTATSGWLMVELQAADDLVTALPQLAPNAAVINIGTNDTYDCFMDPTCGTSWGATELDNVWAPYVTAGVPCRIAVTTVYQPAGITSVNDRIAHLASTGAITHVADWQAHSAGHSEWFVDSIGHLRTAGRDAYTDFILDELASACPLAQ